MQNKTLFPQAARQVCLSCLIMMFYVIAILLNDTPTIGFPVLYILYSLGILFINRLFARRPRTISQIVLLNLACIVAFFAAVLAAGGFLLIWRAFFGFFAILIITVTGASVSFGSLKLNSILLAIDGNILLLLFSVLLLGSLPHPYTWVLFAVVGAVSGLLGALSCRMGRALSLREWGIFALLLLLIALVAWLLFAFIVNPLSTGMYGLGKGLLAGLGFLWEQVNRFLLFLASLWKDDGTTAPELSALPASAEQEETLGSAQDLGIFPVLVVAAIAAVVVIIFIAVLKKTGRNKVAKKRVFYGADADLVQKTSLRQAWKEAILRLKRWLHTKRYLAMYKDRPEGIYYTLCKVCRRTAFEQQPGDTAAEFLGRIREAFSVQEACLETEGQIDELIRRLNINFYSQHPEDTAYPWAGSLIANVKRLGKQNRMKKAGSRKNTAEN